MQVEAPRRTLDVRCCIVGGGPAGMMLGFLLARAGIECVVLEKHADFLRDFRGDTIHPSTLQVMHELGLLDAFLARPHQRTAKLAGQFADTTVTIADFSHLPTVCKFIAFMPQWDFLTFLLEHARRYPAFRLELQADVRDLVFADSGRERIAGVIASTPTGSLEVRADLVIGADGRGSVVRAKSGLEVVDIGAPMDVLWMRVSRAAGDPQQTFGRADAGKILVMIDRGAYWQCGFVIRKGAFEELRARGIDALRADVAELAPFLRDRVAELGTWDDVRLLTVQLDRLRRWYRPGLVCIGDAAHAMSPIGGVGVNLAIQDAVAAANALVPALRTGTCSVRVLRGIQRRRDFPAKATQTLQRFIQARMIGPIVANGTRAHVPRIVRRLAAIPLVQRIPARLIGVGIRPETVRTPETP